MYALAKERDVRAGLRKRRLSGPVLKAHAPAAAPGQSECACGGGCPRCHRLPALQTKTEVSAPGDALEREADQVAEAVMRSSVATHHGHVANGPAIARAVSAAAHAPASVDDALRSPGKPLDAATRGFMEARFNHDFGQVRIHADAIAARSAQALSAQAYTLGNHVVFDTGRYTPHTQAGQQLVAHELAHVVQQQVLGGVVARRIMRTPYPGCDRRTSGADDADARLDRARTQALDMVRTARAAFPRMSGSTIRMVDRHFHCPSTSQIRSIMRAFAVIEGVIPTLAVRCVDASTDFCMESEYVKGQVSPDDGALEVCPASFSPLARAYRLGGTFVHAAAITAGLENLCMKRQPCYNDFTLPANEMARNAYSYTWFAIERAGHPVAPPPTIPCAPLNTGDNVVVPPDAVTDPTRIRPLTGYEEIPPGSAILPVFSDRAGSRFIYHDDLPGARPYLPDGRRRFYLSGPGRETAPE